MSGGARSITVSCRKKWQEFEVVGRLFLKKKKKSSQLVRFLLFKYWHCEMYHILSPLDGSLPKFMIQMMCTSTKYLHYLFSDSANRCCGFFYSLLCMHGPVSVYWCAYLVKCAIFQIDYSSWLIVPRTTVYAMAIKLAD